MILTVILVLLTTVFLFYKWVNMKPKNFPPGPTPLPLIGSIFSFPSRHIEVTFEVWSKRYGQIIGCIFGTKRVVFITGVDNVLAALRKEEFQGRPDDFFVRLRNFRKRLAMFFADGETWQESRRFTVKHLRSFGKEETENLMKEEIYILSSAIKDDSIIQAKGLFGVSAVNVIWMILASKRFSVKDEKARKFLDNLSLSFRLGQPAGSLVSVFPFLRFIEPKHKIQLKIAHDLMEYIRETIEEHKKELDYNAPKDFIDNYLVEMESHEKAGNNTTYSVEDLIVNCTDLFFAGAESTSNTIEFLIMYLVRHPEVQEKLQEELDHVLQRSRRANLDDKNKMPYTMATISETMRINTIAPVAVPHRCTQDTTFNNYSIPKDTTIMIDLWCLGHSKEVWNKPEQFDPTRFLDEDGQLIKHNFFHSFGLGKRVCAGETIARNTIFLFVTTFFEKYTVSLPKGDPLPDTEAMTGFTTAPKPFRVHIKTRY